jgi:hypothetical protein
MHVRVSIARSCALSRFCNFENAAEQSENKAEGRLPGFLVRFSGRPLLDVFGHCRFPYKCTCRDDADAPLHETKTGPKVDCLDSM